MARGNTAVISLATFKADWLAHIPMRGLCDKFSISRDQVIRLKHVWQLPPRHDRRLRAKPVRQRDPTPTEIRAACTALRAKHLEQRRNEAEDRVYRSKDEVSERQIELGGTVGQEIDVHFDAE
jgi:hypothetical protein